MTTKASDRGPARRQITKNLGRNFPAPLHINFPRDLPRISLRVSRLDRSICAGDKGITQAPSGPVQWENSRLPLEVSSTKKTGNGMSPLGLCALRTGCGPRGVKFPSHAPQRPCTQFAHRPQRPGTVGEWDRTWAGGGFERTCRGSSPIPVLLRPSLLYTKVSAPLAKKRHSGQRSCHSLAQVSAV